MNFRKCRFEENIKSVKKDMFVDEKYFITLTSHKSTVNFCFFIKI